MGGQGFPGRIYEDSKTVSRASESIRVSALLPRRRRITNKATRLDDSKGADGYFSDRRRHSRGSSYRHARRARARHDGRWYSD